jgi:hypothetical protein
MHDGDEPDREQVESPHPKRIFLTMVYLAATRVEAFARLNPVLKMRTHEV